VSGGVDEVQLIALTVGSLIVHTDRVELDGDAALPLQLIGIKDLRPHLSLLERTRLLEKAVGQRGLAVVDVGDDAEVPDPLGRHEDSVNVLGNP
jgi:hypothetical protein